MSKTNKKKDALKYEIFGIWYVCCITKIHHYSGSCSQPNESAKWKMEWQMKKFRFASFDTKNIFNENKRRDIQDMKTQWNRCLQTICVYHFDWLYLWFDVTNPSRFGNRRETREKKTEPTQKVFSFELKQSEMEWKKKKEFYFDEIEYSRVSRIEWDFMSDRNKQPATMPFTCFDFFFGRRFFEKRSCSFLLFHKTKWMGNIAKFDGSNFHSWEVINGFVT